MTEWEKWLCCNPTATTKSDKIISGCQKHWVKECWGPEYPHGLKIPTHSLQKRKHNLQWMIRVTNLANLAALEVGPDNLMSCTSQIKHWGWRVIRQESMNWMNWKCGMFYVTTGLESSKHQGYQKPTKQPKRQRNCYRLKNQQLQII